MKELLYLSFDSMQEGVGASQVLAYMRKIVLLRPVTLVSFEKIPPSRELVNELDGIGINWLPLPFGRFGPLGGISRVFRMRAVIDRKKIIHARGNLAGMAAMLKFPSRWIWDCRALQADQRQALTKSRGLSLNVVIWRITEYLLAKRAPAIIVITNAVKPIFLFRYKINPKKMHMISTCADLDIFEQKEGNNSAQVKILLAGTFSPAYDVNLMNKIIFEMKKSRPVSVTIATASGSTDAWHDLDFDTVLSLGHLEMPGLIQNHDCGMSLWKNDLGVCLTSVASTKTAEFLACGRPVFVNSLQGDFGQLIRKYDCGVITDSSSSEDVVTYATKMFELLDDSSTANKCRCLAENHFNLESGIKDLQELYDSIDHI